MALQSLSSTLPKPAGEQVEKDVEALRSDIASLASSVSKLASSAVDDVQGKAEQAMSQMERAVKRNPTQATIAAVGIGFVFGLLLTR